MAERAISLLQGGIKRFPTAAPLYVSHAGLLVLRGRTDQAAGTLRRGLTRDPDAATLHWALASLLVDVGDERDFVREVVRMPPQRREVARGRAEGVKRPSLEVGAVVWLALVVGE